MQIRAEGEFLELEEPMVLKQDQKLLLDASNPGDGEIIWVHIANPYSNECIGTFELPIEDARHFAKQIERAVWEAKHKPSQPRKSLAR